MPVTRASVGETVESGEITLPLDFDGSASTSDILRARVDGDAEPRLVINADGRLDFGDGATTPSEGISHDGSTFRVTDAALFDGHVWARTNTAEEIRLGPYGPGGEAAVRLGQAGDTILYRGAADTLKTDDALEVGGDLTLAADGAALISRSGAAATNAVVVSRVSGDGADRFQLTADGKLQWGDGTNALDISLYRGDSSTLKSDDAFHAAGATTGRSMIADQDVVAQRGQGAEVRVGNRGPASEAGIVFGSAADTNLYRSATDRLKTDDILDIGGNATIFSSGEVDLTKRLQLAEVASAPVGIADAARIYAEDDGAGKTQLMVQFGSGAAQQIAIEP